MNRNEDTTIEAVLEHLIADGAGGIGPPSTRRSRRMKRMASAPSGAVSPCAAGKLKLPVGGRCSSVSPGGTWLGDCVCARDGAAIIMTTMVANAQDVDLANMENVIGGGLLGWQIDTW